MSPLAGRGRSLVRLVAVLLLLPLTPGAAGAQVLASRTYKVVDAGGTVPMDALFSLDPDCRSRGRTEVSLLEPPRGGTVTLQYGTGYPGYVPQNPRWACDRRRVPASLIAYRANPSFRGEDSFLVEIVFPGGVARQTRYFVNVR